MKWWLAKKSFKMFFTMPGWLRGVILLLIALLLILVPVLGLVVGVLILVLALLTLLTWPIRKLGGGMHLPWK